MSPPGDTGVPSVPPQFYGYLSQQQNMMQDYVRTGTYQRAILQNHSDFKDKVGAAKSTKFASFR